VTRDEERDYGQTALALLTNFYERFDTAAVPLARERWASVRLSNGVELYTRVDRIDGHIRANAKGTLDVIDYKSGRSVIDSEDLHNEPAAQVHLLAVADEYGREVRVIRLLYLATGEESRWEPEAEDVDATRETLLAVTWEMYRDREFEARPGPHCARCPYAHVCPDAGRVQLDELVVDADVDF
jgi:RecB family exonuclease